ncbi:hypothetical protein N9L68_02650 [bacterium]|nr:hypothetical protein [bacterium]
MKLILLPLFPCLHKCTAVMSDASTPSSQHALEPHYADGNRSS